MAAGPIDAMLPETPTDEFGDPIRAFERVTRSSSAPGRGTRFTIRPAAVE